MRKIKSVKRWLLGIFFLAILSAASYLLGWSSLLALRSFSIEGTVHQDLIRETIASSRILPEIGSPLARVDSRAITKRVNQLDWVDHSSVSVDWWKHSVTLTIHERVPVAILQQRSPTTLFFDKQGFVFHYLDRTKKLPIVAMENPDGSGTSHALRTLQLRTAGELLKTFPQDFLRSVELITVHSENDIDVITKIEGRSVLIQWGDPTQTALKLKVLHALLATSENSQSTFFDISHPLTPTVR